jgi:predicted nucleic acid-binding protein
MPIDLLLDTNAIIYIAKGDEAFMNCFFSSPYKDAVLGVSIVTYTEALIGARTDDEYATILEMFSGMTIVPFDTSIADILIDIFLMSKKSFRSQHSAGLMIAATALSLDVPLLTNNPRDFSFISGLEVLTPESLSSGD